MEERIPKKREGQAPATKGGSWLQRMRNLYARGVNANSKTVGKNRRPGVSSRGRGPQSRRRSGR